MDSATYFESFDSLARQRRTPHATYRLQFNRAFTFQDAARISDYLNALGISDVYASPVFQACPGSTHGYDICDFNQFNADLGGDAGFREFSNTLRSRHLGLILDMVPNHMGIGSSANQWWMDVLENGPLAAHAHYFDIRWNARAGTRRMQVLLPILGDHFGKVLENGELRIAFDGASFHLAYYDSKLPLCLASYRILLRRIADRLSADGYGGTEQEIRALLRTGLESREARATEQETEFDPGVHFANLKNRLSELHDSNPVFRAALTSVLATVNGTQGNKGNFSRLEAHLRKQHYRLAYWRGGVEEINYRRFFDITDLAAVRMELADVFAASHKLIHRLMRESRITGLRIDHPDGLWDPAQYFRRLQAAFLAGKHPNASSTPSGLAECSEAAALWIDQRLRSKTAVRPEWPLYVVAEKILSEGEELPRDWTIDGTTGYDTLNLINGLFVRPDSETELSRVYHAFIGANPDYAEEVRGNKRRILRTSLYSELRALSRQFKALASNCRHGSDFTLSEIETCLTELLAAFPVYRSYVTEQTVHLSAEDARFITRAVVEARGQTDANLAVLFDFLSDVMLLRRLIPHSKSLLDQRIAFIMRFQQLAGPAMAKGLEDTTFYRYNRLGSLNEVGGHPERFGVSLDEFHARNAERLASWPDTLIATATHDTKRGEDVRARINVLSEIPESWESAVRRWRDLNAGKKVQTDARPAPDANDEYLFYQTLVGMWPIQSANALDRNSIKERAAAYMLKAVKEAKVHTSWIDPNSQYEEALARFVHTVLDDSKNRAFLSDFEDFQKRIAFLGALNSLSQTLLKITLPGIPDFYQGTEFWDLSLVDPDNRRPVDYPVRRDSLEDLKRRIAANPLDRKSLLVDLLAGWRSGQIKQYLIHTALAFRRDHARLFSRGDYTPIRSTGAHAKNVCAFARILDGRAAMIVIPRLCYELTNGVETPPHGEKIWGDTVMELGAEIASQSLQNVLTGESLTLDQKDDRRLIPIGRALKEFPVALLNCRF